MIIIVIFCLLGFLLLHAYKLKALERKETRVAKTAVFYRLWGEKKVTASKKSISSKHRHRETFNFIHH